MSSKINLQTCEYARKSSIFQDNQLIYMTPSQFFDESEENPALLQTAIEELRKLNDDDLMLIIGNIRRLTRE